MKDIIKKLLGNKWLLTLTAIGLLLLLFGASGGGFAQTPPPAHATPVLAGSGGAQAGAITSGGAATPIDSVLADTVAYEKYYDRTLAGILDQIQGVSDVSVMVTVNSTPVNEYGQNQVTTRQNTVQTGSGNRSTSTSLSTQSTLVTVQNASGNQTPVVVSEQMPQIKGVLVVARARNAVLMESEIVNAVQDALGIPSYEVTVLMRK